ncbi:hypothetical protein [Carnimonas bestiolae]|uniref:hypothetical protein n=1 Tax=Carnimonas bestiolae TaxID=3402172 RepID=UPI003EDB9A19
MAHYDVAHIREQGQNMIIIPLGSSFGRKSQQQQSEFESSIQYAASNAGLAGTVVLIWREGNRVSFIAPRQWHAFFKSPGIWNLVARNINKRLTVN